MKPLRSAMAVGLVVALGITAPSTAWAQAPAAPAASGEVTPEALAALKRMSAYLMSLNTFQATATTILDVVTNEGQRIQLDMVTTYKVKRPGFVIEVTSDLKSRRFLYDGKEFTVVAPKMGFYATVPAPPTNKEMLDQIYDNYGIALPLEDLFRWNDPTENRAADLKSGYSVGTATIDGVSTDHYAFRQANLDWEIWIERGDRPIPRKVAIVDRTDPAHPGYTARLNWTLNPALAAADFTFTPGSDSNRIDISTLSESRPVSTTAASK